MKHLLLTALRTLLIAVCIVSGGVAIILSAQNFFDAGNPNSIILAFFGVSLVAGIILLSWRNT